MDYPNREHKKADESARRRALAALNAIDAEVFALRGKLEHDPAEDAEPARVDADDMQTMSDAVRKLTGHLAELGVLHDVREWHAADEAEKAKA